MTPTSRLLSLLLATTLAAAAATAQTAPFVDYQFNEVRGQFVANAAATSPFPTHGTVPNTNWQRDPNRALWSGNDVGFGCLAQTLTANTNVLDTGSPFTHAGSLTVMFWARRDPSSTSTSPFGYFFGDGSFRCFMGSAGILLGNHGILSATLTANFQGHLVQGVWNHYAIVIDDTAGVVTIYENGVPNTRTSTFTAGTYVYNGVARLAVAANGVTGTSRATAHYDMDDFRMYAAALTPAEIAAAASGESASATVSGTGCAGPAATPTIGTLGGAPQLGNTSFTLAAGNLEVGRPQALNCGLNPAAVPLPFDLSTVLGAGFTGCFVEVLPNAFSTPLPGTASASLPLPIPPLPSLAGKHLYVQTLVLGSQGAVSPLLDVNLQN